MTSEDREFLDTIMNYADEVMPDIDPQKVRVSEQIEKLRPILQELAMKHKMWYNKVLYYAHFPPIYRTGRILREKEF